MPCPSDRRETGQPLGRRRRQHHQLAGPDAEAQRGAQRSSSPSVATGRRLVRARTSRDGACGPRSRGPGRGRGRRCGRRTRQSSAGVVRADEQPQLGLGRGRGGGGPRNSCGSYSLTPTSSAGRAHRQAARPRSTRSAGDAGSGPACAGTPATWRAICPARAARGGARGRPPCRGRRRAAALLTNTWPLTSATSTARGSAVAIAAAAASSSRACRGRGRNG